MPLKSYFEGTKGIEKAWYPSNTITNKHQHVDNPAIDGGTKTAKLHIDINKINFANKPALIRQGYL